MNLTTPKSWNLEKNGKMVKKSRFGKYSRNLEIFSEKYFPRNLESNSENHFEKGVEMSSQTQFFY